MRVAIVHDYLAQAGGAERVIEALHELWPDAPIYTSVYDPKATLPSFQQMDIRTSFLQRFKFARQAKTHKMMLPFFPTAFEHFDMRGYDLVFSNTTSFAKGVITDPETVHVCYCHTPARFAWRYHEYISQGNFGGRTKKVLPFLVHYLRSWDLAAANRVDFFISNSFNIAKRVKKYYGRDSDVLYPPVEARRFHITPNPTADYLLVVSRMLPYKKVDLAIEACNKLGVKLKVAGGGPDLDRLRAMAGPTVEVLGRVPDGQVEPLFANCKAFLFPGEEDFGIAPLEAMASGRPVIAFGAGGATETVVDGKTGVFFKEPTPESLMDAIKRLDNLTVDPPAIRAHAETFDVKAFHARVNYLVDKYMTAHRSGYGVIRPGIPDSDPKRTSDAPPPSMNGAAGHGKSAEVLTKAVRGSSEGDGE
jgi:glycosyltransferase involved in cell wall biosynthesis